MTVVGQAIFNDSSDLEAGVGALVTKSYYQDQQGSAGPSRLLVRVREGSNLAAAMTPFAEAGASWFVPTPPAAVRNIERVRWLPWLLAILVTGLAAGALGHALYTSVRVHRRDLAVLRAMGFTSAQTSMTVLWEAFALFVGAIAIGVPLGVCSGDWAGNCWQPRSACRRRPRCRR